MIFCIAETPCKSIKGDDGDAGTAELYMLVTVGFYTIYRVEILSYALAQYPITRAVQYSHLLGIELYGVIDKIRHSLYRLIGSHSAHIDVGRKF